VFGPERAVESPDVEWALDHLGLSAVADRVPGELSQAERKYLALARGIAARPKILLLDEPAAGLDQEGTEELGRRLRRVVAEGIGLLLVDHDMALVLKVCDYVYVLDTGRVIAAGTPSEIRTNKDVLRSYLGEEPPEPSADSGGET
jgi:branched-chain amino acid transport system ATP-binding protein